MTVKEYAKLKSVTIRTVQKWIKDGKVQARKSRNKYIITENPDKSTGDKIEDVKRRKLEAEAKIKERDYDVKSGKYIDRAEVIQGVKEACGMWWDRLRRVGHRVADDCMAAETKGEVVKIIQNEIDTIMRTMREDAMEAAEGED